MGRVSAVLVDSRCRSVEDILDIVCGEGPCSDALKNGLISKVTI